MWHFLETAAVIVLGLAIWLVANWVPPMSRGQAKVTAKRQDFSRFSLRTLFVLVTLAALMIALALWLVR